MHSGGNAIPVLVRPEANGRYTLGYGVLRTKACRDLGLPVVAIAENVDGVSLFVRMMLENSTERLTAFERGTAFARGLDTGLFPSARKLAEAMGVGLSEVHACLQLARLPTEVIASFPQATDIKASWSRKLADAQERDPVGLIARANAIRVIAGASELLKAAWVKKSTAAQEHDPANFTARSMALRIHGGTAATVYAELTRV